MTTPTAHVLRLCRCVAIIGTALCALGAQIAVAHVTSGKRWYFAGKTYTNDTPKKAKDPVNWIFYGGSSNVTNAAVGDHIQSDWNDPAEGSVMEDRWCKSSQRMVWSSLTGTQISDKQDFHRMSNCLGTQFHTRMWDDWEHSKITTHARYSWVVGGIHHERIEIKKPCCVTHSIDRDWDTVRIQAVKAMKTHCSYRRWRYHPGARGRFQGYFNSGFIARISLRHRSSGCSGA